MRESLFPTDTERFNWYFFQKRTIDLVLIILLSLTFLWWILPILVIAVWIDSKGPVFIARKGRGRYFKHIRTIRFRTDIIGVDGRSYNTKLGGFLQRTGLEMLPSILFVFSGDLSLVGPAPFTQMEDERFSVLIKGYYLRYNMKPGLTGMAQIKGFPSRQNSPINNEEFNIIFHRFQWDNFYSRNANLRLDARILFISVKKMLSSLTRSTASKREPAAIPMLKVFRSGDRMGALNN